MSELDKDQIDRWDAEHSWHPFSQMQEYLAAPPLHIERGEGCWLYDTQDHRYLDTNASVWTNVHGHNDPELNAVLEEQLHKVAHSTYLGLSHPIGATLGHKLAELAPGNLQRVLFSDNGSNAIEIALKLSYQYWHLRGESQRTKVIGMQGGYHGDTIGTMAVGNSGRFHERFKPWFLDAFHFPAPICHEYDGEVFAESSEESLRVLENYLQKHAKQTACLVMEPSVQGAAGMLQQPKGFLKAVATLCKKYHIHLILDEVFVAFGRLGSMLVCKEEAVEPDFLCLAKGLTAGYLPLAATIVREDIYEAFLGPFAENKTFFHGHTFTANPLAASVALKSIEKLDTRISSGKVADTIQYFGQCLRSHLANHPNVSVIRQRGLAACIELQAAPGKPAWDPDARTGWHLSLAAREAGLIIRPLGDAFLLVPPIVISRDEIDFLFERLLQVLAEIES